MKLLIILVLLLVPTTPSPSTWCPVHHQYAKYFKTERSANTCAFFYRDYAWTGPVNDRKFEKHEFTIPCDSKGY